MSLKHVVGHSVARTVTSVLTLEHHVEDLVRSRRVGGRSGETRRRDVVETPDQGLFEILEQR